MLMALPGVSSGVDRGGMGGMGMEGHGGMAAKSGGPDVQNGEKIFSRFAGMRHLMLFLTDPATGNLTPGVAGKVIVTGPDKASSSMVTLVEMGEHMSEHIGSDVHMPVPGKYTFKAEIESGGQKGYVTFFYTLK